MALDWSLPTQPDELDNLFNMEMFGAAQSSGNDLPYPPMSWDDDYAMPSSVPGLEDWGVAQLDQQQYLIDLLHSDTQTGSFSDSGPLWSQPLGDFPIGLLNIANPSPISMDHSPDHGETSSYTPSNNVVDSTEICVSIERKAERRTTTAKRRGDDSEPSQSRGKPKFRRTKIAANTRTMLEQYFLGDPYPADSDIALLSTRFGLDTRSIKTWFSNARSRNIVPRGKSITFNVAYEIVKFVEVGWMMSPHSKELFNLVFDSTVLKTY
ncbi:Nn.00g117910.m01.CDS01 [Neocucurbitaria sp. VM-36]